MYRIYKKPHVNKMILFANDLVSVAKFIIPHLKVDIDEYVITKDGKDISLMDIRKEILMRERQRKVKKYQNEISHLNSKIDKIDVEREKDKKEFLKT